MTVHVREFESADALMAHYKLLKRRAAANRPAPILLKIAPPLRMTIYSAPIGPQPLSNFGAVSGSARTKKIIIDVCRKHGIEFADLAGPRRLTHFVIARQEAAYRLRMELATSYPQIGRLLGGRDHSTQLYAVKKYTQRLIQGTATL